MSKIEALQALGDSIRIPALPETVARINEGVADSRVGSHELARLIASDAAITARALQLANSSYYGLSEPVTTVERAATVIGPRALRNVAMQVALVRRYGPLANTPGFDLEDLWRHSVATAHVAQALSEASYRRTGLAPEDFYAAGLLHDIGQAVLFESLGERYVECVRRSRVSGAAIHEAEETALGFTHIEVSSTLASRWGLPEKVAQAIEFHHGPKEMVATHAHVAVLALADHMACRGNAGEIEVERAALSALAERTLGIRRDEFERVAERARASQPHVLV
jgi:putative nucleotidyltransferase with HDIG domain